ncbi:MAG: glycine cleavage system protein GcvH [Acidobacteriota bacterium]
MSDYPSEYLYSEEHEWLNVDGDTATVGITVYAQSELGEVVFVELPEVGASYAKGDEIGTIESVKAVAELYAPIGCEVLEVNTTLDDAPELVNDEPHGDGWICKIKIADSSEVEQLMSAEQYGELASGDD